MANPHRGEVSLTVGDKTYILRLTTNELVEAEELGVDVTNAAAIAKLGAVRVLFWVALRAQMPAGFDLRAAGDLMTEVGINQAGEKVVEAVRAAFPNVFEGEGNPQVASPDGTGATS